MVGAWLLYPRERNTAPILQEAGWAPGPVWTEAENLAPNGIRSLDRPARSESLYRLSYRGSPSFYKRFCMSDSRLPPRLSFIKIVGFYRDTSSPETLIPDQIMTPGEKPRNFYTTFACVIARMNWSFCLWLFFVWNTVWCPPWRMLLWPILNVLEINSNY